VKGTALLSPPKFGVVLNLVGSAFDVLSVWSMRE
jgi:hypothetical protein